MAARAKTKTCPLCGSAVAGGDLDALGKHFETCPKTETGRGAATDTARRGKAT